MMGNVLPALILSNAALELMDDDVALSERQDHVIKLIPFAMLFFFQRLLWTPLRVRCVTIALAAMRVAYRPQLGVVFGDNHGRGECIALLLFAGLGELLGHCIDEIQRTIFVLNFKQTHALSRALEEQEQKSKAVEEFLIYKETVLQHQHAKEKASKKADSMLNHTLKNVLADGIAAVELYQLTGESTHLANATLSMKRGMTWTRRRQSLIMVCEGTYQLHPEKLCLRQLVRDCIDGRDIVFVDNAACGAVGDNIKDDWWVEIDPMLIGMILENGISNAIKHNPIRADPPRITVTFSPTTPIIGDGEFTITLRNKATPGAPFITKQVEERLFQEGVHDSSLGSKNANANSSDGVGLAHSRTVAKLLLDGHVSLKQNDDVVSFGLRVRTPLLPKRNNNNNGVVPTPSSVLPLPSNSKNSIALSPTIQKARRGMLLDDSLLARKYAEKVLFPKLLGLQDWLVLGEDQAQLDLSVSIAAVLKPDIVIIDENFDFEFSPDQKFCSGTEICRALAHNQNKTKSSNKKEMLLCIRSGNTSPDDIQDYVRAGAHFVICKSFNNKALAKPLLDGFRFLQEEQAALDDTTKEKKKKSGSVFPILLLD